MDNFKRILGIGNMCIFSRWLQARLTACRTIQTDFDFVKLDNSQKN